MVHFEHKKWPALSDTQIKTADAVLHREYVKKLEQLRMQTKGPVDQGGVTDGNLSKAEETWQSYREAWDAFARMRYPSAVSAIGAQITLDRYRLLKSMR
jgi:hypothetical protein